MALESFPPVILVCVRFLLSGALLLGAAATRQAHFPRGRELAYTAINGVIVLGIGNLCLTFAELWIPSGLAALFLTTSPFWLVGIEATLPGGERLRTPTMVGLLTGLAGTALLISPDTWRQGLDSNTLKGFLILQVGCLGWNAGSIAQRRLTTRAHPIVSGAVQQFAVGLFYLLPALLAPQPAIQWSTRGVLALLWLVTFGSIVGYSSFIYALDRLPVSLVSIHTYINPVVAVGLGWLFYREPFGPREVLAVAVIFLGVWVVKRHGHRATIPAPEPSLPARPPASAAT